MEAKKSQLSLTFYTIPGQESAGYIKMNDEPYIVAKVVKLKHWQAMQMERRQTAEQKEKVEGYNVFLLHHGFAKRPVKPIPEKWVTVALKDMCRWYYENKIAGQPSLEKLLRTEKLNA
jgi:hypothetical protein